MSGTPMRSMVKAAATCLSCWQVALAAVVSTQQHQSRDVPELPSLHFIYTTGCDDYQLTHSVVFDYTWAAVHNTGRLTRIVAGCKSDDERKQMSRSPLRDSKNFSVFFAEGDLSLIPATGERYMARARPHAITQWMTKSPPDEEVIALADPDFCFLRPISEHPDILKVRRGQMVSSSGWSYQDGSREPWVAPEFQTGPLWLLHRADLWDMLPDWASLTDSWKKVQDGLMREQFALQLAAERHSVPAVFAEDFTAVTLPLEGEANYYILHYYRSYNYRSWGFHKALSTSGWYADHFRNSVPPPVQCGAPLLQEPPPPRKDSQEATTLYALIPRMNRAFRALREVHCPDDAAAFERHGTAAFGLVRTMHPIRCTGQAGSFTRYRVSEDQVAAWDGAQALDGSRCSEAAQSAGPAGRRAGSLLM